MTDYANPINIHDYKYRKPVYYTNPFSTYVTNIVVKLILTSENFNFNLTKDDGSDFRLLSGLGVLNMWIADWSKTRKYAVLFFKIPAIGGDESVTFSAYWGNTLASSISDPESLGFLFYESFNSSTLSASKWSGNISAGSTSYGYLIPMNDSFTSITNPLTGKSNWIMEAGIYVKFNGGVITSSYRCIGFEFVGTENNFHIELMATDYLRHNATAPAQASTNTIYQTYGGLEDDSYQEVYIDYYEPDDRITVKLQDRDVYNDVSYQIWRKVEGDTRLQNVRLRGTQVGQYAGGYPVYVSWLVLRERDGISLSSLDGRDLYIPYENVPAQPQDYRPYSPDFTSVQYQHETSFGGNPYLLSNEGFDADSNVWISDEGASLSGVALTIHIGWSEDITSTSYTHYDSGHDYYYNASKLSDSDTDRMGRNYWSCTTTSGWAAIKFPDYKSIGAFRIKNANMSFIPASYAIVKFNTTAMPHASSTILNGSANNLSDGSNTSYWQTYYYVGIPEWVSINLGVSKTIYKVILAGGSDGTNRCAKNFRIQGSSDNINWNTVYTGITAMISGPQEFVFPSISDPYRYWRLYMLDNWGSSLLEMNRFELYHGTDSYYATIERCSKDFVLYGSNLNPTLHFDKAIKLIEGTFEVTPIWQSRVFTNTASYKYYILQILNTYGNENIKIQEWEMMENLGQVEKKYPSQLRLHPALYSNWQYNFPKEISLQGSVDGVNWTTLLPWTSTYTPFVQHYAEDGYWQIFSFNNVVGFWSFKLLCRGNWEAEDNKIIIGEWSLHELEEESYTYRILDGTTNNIQQIWATTKCGIDDKYGVIFIPNEKMNRVSDNRLVGSSNLPTYYEDFNVI